MATLREDYLFKHIKWFIAVFTRNMLDEAILIIVHNVEPLHQRVKLDRL